MEKILKPVRINPVTLGISLASFGLSYVFSESDNTIGQIASVFTNGIGGFFLGYYSWGVENYLRDGRILKEHGFDERHGVLRMEHYCNRQAFNVAGIERGYSDEVRELIERTPNKEKKFWYLPHI